MNEAICNKIIALINSAKSDEEIRKALANYHESDIADALEQLDKDERIRLYKILGNETTSDILSYADNIDEYIDELDFEHAADIIEQMDVDDAIDVLDEIDEEDRDEIVKRMEGEIVEELSLLGAYEDTQIGSHMTTNYIAIHEGVTIAQAMRHVIAEAATNDNVSVIYVIDEADCFKGAVLLRDLIIARKETPLAEITKTSYPTVLATAEISDVLQELKDYAPDAIPVVDDTNKLIGAITSDDILESVDAEYQDDYAKLGGLSSAEDLAEPVFKSVMKRLPWLSILLVIGLLVSLLIAQFEAVIVVLPVIVFFQSLILDMAGNVGTQSLAVTIRVLTDSEANRKMRRRTLLKELRIGFFNGIFMGILAFGVVMLFLIIKREPIVQGETYNITHIIKASGAVGIAMFSSIVVSSFVGTFTPMFFQRLKIDPAVASGPFITTVNDIVAILLYYGIVALLFTSYL